MKKVLLYFRSYSPVLVLLLVSTMAGAQKIATTSGMWNSAATWGGAAAPTSADDVVINNGVTVTINVASAQCKSITIGNTDNAGGITISGTNSLAVTNGVTIGALLDNTSGITIAVGAGTFSCATLTMADITSSNDAISLSVSTGTATIGDIIMNGGVGENTVNITGTGTLNITGSISQANGTFGVSSTSTVNYSGAAQTVRPTTYGNLVLSGSGVKTTTGVTIDTKLSMQGTATAGNAVTYSTAILEYKGSSAQTTGAEFPSSPTTLAANLIVDNPSGVTLNAAKIVSGNILLTSGTLNAGNNLSISLTGTPLITVDGGSLSGNLQGAADYDLVYIGGSKTTTGELSGSGLHDVDVNLNSGETLTLDQNRVPHGDLTILGGSTFDLSSFTFNRFNGGGTLTVNDNATLKIGGTNSFPGNYNTHSLGNTSSTVEYAGTNQTVATLAGLESYTNLTISGSGVKTFTGETVNATLSVRGTATTAGTSTVFGNNAILEYAGSAAQTSANAEFPATNGPRNLIINNGNGVTLHAARTLITSLTLTNGLLNTTATNILNIADNGVANGGSDNSFVNGPLAKTGNDAFTFPVGVAGQGMRTIGITAPGSTGSVFTAQFLKADPHSLSSALGAGLVNISACEYWTLANTGTATSASVILSWSPNSCNGAPYVGNLATLRVARLNAGTWADEGNFSTTGSATAGTIRSGAAISSFTSFTLATVSVDNPLPVVLADVKAYQQNGGVQIEWSNLTEKDLVNYIVERSVNGSEYSAIGQQSPRSNYSDKQSYTAFDPNPATNVNYYRIKVQELNGKAVYSKVMRVDMGKAAQGFSLYPNPVQGNIVSVSMNNKQGQYNIKVSTSGGQEIYSRKIVHLGGSMTQSVELPSGVKPGVYSIVISGEGYHEAKMFIVR